MRILTVRQPWAWAIIHGGKDVENRVRNVAGDYRGPVAIHVGKADADTAPESLWRDHAAFYQERSDKPRAEWSWKDCDRGAIIGVVDLIGVHRATPSTLPSRLGVNVCWDDKTPPGEACSHWALPAPIWHLKFAHPRPLDHPIPFTGALGLRELPGDVEQAVLAEVGG